MAAALLPTDARYPASARGALVQRLAGGRLGGDQARRPRDPQREPEAVAAQREPDAACRSRPAAGFVTLTAGRRR